MHFGMRRGIRSLSKCKSSAEDEDVNFAYRVPNHDGVFSNRIDLSIVIDGLDRVKRQKVEFIREVRELVEHLQGRISKVKALLTSQPEAEIKEVLDGLPCIEYDKERKGSATSRDSDSKLSSPY